MYNQLLVSSGNGMQKVCKIMDNWIWQNHCMKKKMLLKS